MISGNTIHKMAELQLSVHVSHMAIRFILFSDIISCYMNLAFHVVIYTNF